MIRVSRKVEYGLIALRHMGARPDRLVSAKELSQSYGLSPALTAKVLQAMTHHGILASEQGIRGGYRLRKSLSEVSYLDLQTAILGPLEESRHRDCEMFERCVVVEPVEHLEERIRGLLADTSIAELFAKSTDDECCRSLDSAGAIGSATAFGSHESRKVHSE